MENMSCLSNGQATNKRLKLDSEEYSACANDCITLHLVDPAKTKGSSWPPTGVTSSFKPEFTHQIFGDDEEIVGYKALAIDIYFSQLDFRACIDVKFEDKAHGATDIFTTVSEHFPGGIIDDTQLYLSAIATCTPTDLGVAIASPASNAGVMVRQTNLAKATPQLQVRRNLAVLLPSTSPNALFMNAT